MAQAPIPFPQNGGGVPLVGQPCTIHPTWFITAPITCNCEAHTPLLVFFGANMPPAVCPKCLNVFGLVLAEVKGGTGRIAVQVIGRAQHEVKDADVEKTLSDIVETLN